MIRDQLVEALRDALVVLGVDPIPEVINIEQPARREHGDWSSNVALAAAKKAGRNPRELAQQVADHLTSNPPAHVRQVDIAGPGFVNFHLDPSWLHSVLTTVVGEGTGGYARPDLNAGRTGRVNVEFVSANPTGPLHPGHGRNACYGDSVARLLTRCGFEVSREYYLNDRGVQMEKFAQSLLARKKGEDVPEDGYRGQYIIDWAAEMPDEADPGEWGEARAIADHRAVLAAMGIEFDIWFSERSLVDSGAIDATLADLRASGHVYDDGGAVWLRTTDFGDDKDRVLVKSSGEFTYVLPDIAYHRDKFGRGFDRLIDVWGADHHGYVARMKAALQILGHDPDEFHVALTQFVTLLRDGEEVKISKRTGDLVELRDLIDEVGADAARLTFLLQSADTQQGFDLAKVAAQGMENPVFYVQMAHARLHAIGRKAAEVGIVRQPLDAVDLSLLIHEREVEILRTLAELPDTVALACRERAPHKIATWVRELAGTVHGFHHDCYVISDQTKPELTQARLWLVDAAIVGLAIGLDLLGVSAPDAL